MKSTKALTYPALFAGLVCTMAGCPNTGTLGPQDTGGEAGSTTPDRTTGGGGGEPGRSDTAGRGGQGGGSVTTTAGTAGEGGSVTTTAGTAGDGGSITTTASGGSAGSSTGGAAGGAGCPLCDDVDECALETTCDPQATCLNTPGSFTCTCKDGYAGDGLHCEDIDECALEAPCDLHASCTNDPGSFTCTCDEGYVGDGLHCELGAGIVTDCDTAPCLPTCGDAPGLPPCQLAGCEPPAAACGSSCVDLESAHQHCGACDNPCAKDQACLGGTCAGTGALQITATWSRPGDGELQITTPGGMTIARKNPGPDATTELGQMDLIDHIGTGPENIFWEEGAKPPSGTYHVCFGVGFFEPPPSDLTPVRYAIIVRSSQAAPLSFTGAITKDVSADPCYPGQHGYVASFTYP